MAEPTTHRATRCLNRLEVGPDGTARQKEPREPFRPPTAAQRRFARAIADKLRLSLPAAGTFRAYWLFIHAYADEFYAHMGGRWRDF